MKMPPELSTQRKTYLSGLRRDKRRILTSQILLFVLFFTLWELFVRVGWLDGFIFSSPSRAAGMMGKMIADGSLWLHIGVTLGETAAGFLIGTLLGAVIAILLWAFPKAERVLDPYLVVLNSLPKIALGPVIIVWVGSGVSAVITVTILVSVVNTVIGMASGFREAEGERLALLKSFGATRLQTFLYAVLPGSLPTMISILKINIGMAWVGVIVGEFLTSRAGLGYLIVYGGQVFRMDLVMGSVLVLSLLAALMYLLVVFVEKEVRRLF